MHKEALPMAGCTHLPQSLLLGCLCHNLQGRTITTLLQGEEGATDLPLLLWRQAGGRYVCGKEADTRR